MKTLSPGLEENKGKGKEGTTALRFPWQQLPKAPWGAGLSSSLLSCSRTAQSAAGVSGQSSQNAHGSDSAGWAKVGLPP